MISPPLFFARTFSEPLVGRAYCLLASKNNEMFFCQVHTSLRLRKNRSIIPFCSGVHGVTNSWHRLYSDDYTYTWTVLLRLSAWKKPRSLRSDLASMAATLGGASLNILPTSQRVYLYPVP